MVKGFSPKHGYRRIAITFNDELFDYLNVMSEERDQSFSALVGSLLTEIMRDDRNAED